MSKHEPPTPLMRYSFFEVIGETREEQKAERAWFERMFRAQDSEDLVLRSVQKVQSKVAGHKIGQKLWKITQWHPELVETTDEANEVARQTRKRLSPKRKYRSLGHERTRDG